MAVNVGATPETPVEWYLDGVRQFLTKRGGADNIKGDVVAALLDLLIKVWRGLPASTSS